jgi:hypothetical protein
MRAWSEARSSGAVARPFTCPRSRGIEMLVERESGDRNLAPLRWSDRLAERAPGGSPSLRGGPGGGIRHP